jgi:serine/threonine-protein kinase RsbW
MANLLLHEKLDATLVNVRSLRSYISAICSAYNFGEKETNSLLLALSEQASNVIRHSTPRANTLELRIEDVGRYWQFIISDDGGEFVHHTDLCEMVVGVDDLGLCESGMGLSLIRSLYPDYEYSRIEEKNIFLLQVEKEDRDKKPCIAIVDDDLLLRELLQVYLADDYKVLVFENGKEALHGLAGTDVDLVISDINMPELDGLTLRRILRNDAKLHSLPFIFLTGDDGDRTAAQAAQLSIDDYLTKPIGRQQLNNVVMRVLSRTKEVSKRLDESITATLRPETPSFLGSMKLACRSLSAGSGGGDFISTHLNQDGGLIILGDVMGHGDVAKFFAHAHAGYIRGILSAIATPQSPVEVLNELRNAVSIDEVMSNTLLTCLLVGIDGEQLTIASAGHPAPIVFSEDEIFELPASGPLLALSGQQQFSQLEFLPGMSQRLLMFTDGLFDGVGRQEDGNEFRQQLLHFLQKNMNMSLANLADEILSLFESVCDDQPQDDMTFILMERV